MDVIFFGDPVIRSERQDEIPDDLSARPVPDGFDLFCELCGYSLVGLIHTNQCPECGNYFDPAALPLARVPWLFRRHRGMVAAYVQTVQLVLFSPWEFAAELCRPVRISVIDAGLFRRFTSLTIAIATAAVVILAGVVQLMRRDRDGLLLIAESFGVFGGMWSFAHFATDSPTFIWRGLDPDNHRELSPLQHYASAPMSLLAIPLFSGAAGLFLAEIFATFQIVSVICYAVGIALGMYLLWRLWFTPVIFMRVSTGCTHLRAVILFVYLPIHYVLIACMAVVLGFICSFLGLAIVFGITTAFGIKL